jgi:predicted HD superfamily hydrolase involved in NAD metabolism
LVVHPALAGLVDCWVRTGDLQRDVTALLERHACFRILEHTTRVARLCRQLARQWGEDETAAEFTGWLHDVGGVVPVSERERLAETLGLEIVSEERMAPLLLHQKLSATMAREAFAIEDIAILTAIGCHTTLRRDASVLDKILFISDKLEWDQDGEPPYWEQVAGVVERSLDEAAWWYLDYLWAQRDTLAAIHPWLIEAHQQLSATTTSAMPTGLRYSGR